ncbi:MAG: AI-2E family transporter [Pseudolabrys sp.]|nr:AI-2E family transporter [Pseudolabrys sp.]MCW5696121.1 AI-2E family transporter [Bauldia sp.]
MAPRPQSWESIKADLLPYLRRLILTIIVIALALLIWALRDVALLAFASVLVAIVLLAETRLIRRVTGLGHKTSLAIAGALTVLILGGTIGLSWPAFEEQMSSLFVRLQASIGELEDILGIQLPSSAEEVGADFGGIVDRVWSVMVTVAQAAVTIVTSFFLVVIAGAFIAADPATYKAGLVLLFPKTWHDIVRAALDKTGRGLRLWLQAQLLTMLIVGTLVGIGATIIGLPSPLALGLIAGLTEFVPIIGPFAGAAPAVLIAASIDTPTLVWTVLLYVFVQQLEGNLITPLMQKRIAAVPPVLLLFAFVAFGLLFGVPGIIVAAPLTIALYILVREFYVAELLNEREQLDNSALPLPGQAAPDPDPKGAEEAAKAPTRRRVRKPPTKRKS